MADTTPINNERHLPGELRRALDALERTTGVKGKIVRLEPNVAPRDRPDAVIDIYAHTKKYRFIVEAKKHVDRLAALGPVKAQLDQTGKRGLLFAPYITAEIAKKCRQLDLAFLDTAGNAYLHEPGLHIYITGEKPQELLAKTKGIKGGGTATALRVIFALLCNPKLLNAPYRDIVETADVALGAIGGVFFNLEARGQIAGKKTKHNRRFLEPMRLVDEWVTNYPIKLRQKLNPRRFRAENPDWWKEADLAEVGAYWGGEIAAMRLTNYLKPTKCTLYMVPDQDGAGLGREIPTLILKHRLRADPNGNIEILDAFWNCPPTTEYPDIVPPVLVYADLVATLDPRNLEVAKLIRERYIENALRQP